MKDFTAAVMKLMAEHQIVAISVLYSLDGNRALHMLTLSITDPLWSAAAMAQGKWLEDHINEAKPLIKAAVEAEKKRLEINQ